MTTLKAMVRKPNEGHCLEFCASGKQDSTVTFPKMYVAVVKHDALDNLSSKRLKLYIYLIILL